MPEFENRECFTVCVFQDTEWASRGLDALKDKGFNDEVISVLSRQTSDSSALVVKAFGEQPASIEVKGLGSVVARGPLVGALQGSDDGPGTHRCGRNHSPSRLPGSRWVYLPDPDRAWRGTGRGRE